VPSKGQLVSQHLGKISGTILDDYPELIRSYVKGKHGIYALYRGNHLYYVGQASNLRVRLRHHLKDRHAKKWDRFSIYITTDVEHMRDLESLIIHIAAPRENRLKGGFVANERGNWERLLNLRNKVTAKPLRKTKKESTLKEFDTVICPSNEEGFREVFMGKNCWYAIRLSKKRIRNIKYIAVYRKRPISAITHYATVKSIISYKDTGKFIVKFKNNPRKIGPIHLVKMPGKKKVGPQAPFFSYLKIIKAAKTISDLWG